MRRVSERMNGLLGQGRPENRFRRRVLPPREARLRGLVPTAASPVPTTRAPLGPISSRQPPWRPLVVGSPVSSCRWSVACALRGPSRQAITLMSCPPPVLWLPWQV